MPKIEILEKEDEVNSFINPTDTAVLVPLICDSSASDTAKLYTQRTKSNFIADFASLVVTQTDSSFTTPIKEKSYAFIYNLLCAGLNVVVKPIIKEATSESAPPYSEADIENILTTNIPNAFAEFESKNKYNIKFITTGAHANYLSNTDGTLITGCYSELVDLAKLRSDCVALIELQSDVTCAATDKPISALTGKDIKKVLGETGDGSEKYNFAACVYPWCFFDSITDGSNSLPNILMPASFAYLKAFANNIQTNADWYATAGVVRGVIPDFKGVNTEVTEAAMHMLLNETSSTIKFNVIPIMDVTEYGYRIWGNRVARFNKATESYMNYLNIRLLLCNIEKQIYAAATRVTFEPNDMITWLNFQNLANDLLDNMQANRGIEWYSWRRKATTRKATIAAVLTIKPIEAVESFDITINLSNEEVSVEEI